MTTPTQAAKDLVYRFEHESAALHRIQRDWLVKEIAALEAATIERCAQVVKAWQKMSGAMPGSTIHTLCNDIFAALDKLKDE